MRAVLGVSTRKVAGLFDVTTYTNHSAMQRMWANKALQKISFKPRETLLDAGCGSGEIAAFLAEENPLGWVTGLDASSKMIDFAKKKYPQTTHPKLTFERCRIVEMRTQNRYDIALSFSTLHWIENQKLALSKLKASLKKGGKLLLLVPKRGPFNVGSVVNAILEEKAWAKTLVSAQFNRTYLTLDEYEALHSEVSLKLLEASEETCIHLFHSREELFQWLKPLVTLPFARKEEQTVFLQEMCDRYERLAPQNEQGAIAIPFTMMTFLSTT